MVPTNRVTETGDSRPVTAGQRQRRCCNLLHGVAHILGFDTPSRWVEGSNATLHPNFNIERDIPPRLLSPETSDLAPAGFGQQVRDATDRRRIKTQTVLPCAEAVPMLLWALLASGQIQMRKVDGWETLSQPIEPMPLDLAA